MQPSQTGTHKLRRALGVFTFALVSGMLLGCAPGGSEPKEPVDVSSEQATERAAQATTEQPPGQPSSGEIDLLAKVTVNAPPVDLLWRFSIDLPAGWTTETYEDEGTVQVNVSPRCLIQFRQPAGFGEDAKPDSEQVAYDFTDELGQTAFGAPLTITVEEPKMLGATINDGALAAQLSFARVSFRAEDIPDLAGTTYALRSGNFALVATALCGDNEFESYGAQMRELIESAQADVTY